MPYGCRVFCLAAVMLAASVVSLAPAFASTSTRTHTSADAVDRPPHIAGATVLSGAAIEGGLIVARTMPDALIWLDTPRSRAQTMGFS